VPHTFVRWGHVEDAAQLLRGLATLPAERFALAEATNSVLCTSDEKLSKGHRARVVLFTH
jgi:predicted nucleic acid-binding protein